MPENIQTKDCLKVEDGNFYLCFKLLLQLISKLNELMISEIYLQ